MLNTLNNRIKHVTFNVVNLPKSISNRVLGENHSIEHRVMVGIGIMVFGVLIANVHTALTAINLFFEGVGYLFHAIGGIPIIEHLSKVAREEERKEHEHEQHNE